MGFVSYSGALPTPPRTLSPSLGLGGNHPAWSPPTWGPGTPSLQTLQIWGWEDQKIIPRKQFLGDQEGLTGTCLAIKEQHCHWLFMAPQDCRGS